MQDGMLIHIPMSRKPININIHNMAKSEVYNIDCIEYMRTLPDDHFDLAVCDPPYGHGNDESLLGGGYSRSTTKRFGGCFQRYFTPQSMEQAQRGTEGTILLHRIGGGQTASPTMGRCTTTRAL